MIDTHCHLYDTAFDADREQALQRAVDAGVSLMLLPAIDSASTAALDALHASHPDRTRRMAGLHPTSVNDNWESELALVARQLGIDGSPAPRDYVAVGEIGMDLYWDRTFEAQQTEVLERQLRWAISLDLPVTSARPTTRSSRCSAKSTAPATGASCTASAAASRRPTAPSRWASCSA